MTQAALARTLEMTPSYLNQIEQNQRPLTVPVLLKLNAALGLDVQMFSEGEAARTLTDRREALADQGAAVSLAELRELAANMPEVARTIIAMQRTAERADLMASRLSEPGQAAAPTAFEAVRDWFYNRRNHVPELDTAAEAIGSALPPGDMLPGLTYRLAVRPGIRIGVAQDSAQTRSFDPAERILRLSPQLSPGQRAFQIATQLAFIEQGETLARLSAVPALAPDAQCPPTCRAGQLLRRRADPALSRLPGIGRGQRLRHRPDRPPLRRGLRDDLPSSVHPPAPRGAPFFFIRGDRAGNISKRQLATDFHF